MINNSIKHTRINKTLKSLKKKYKGTNKSLNSRPKKYNNVLNSIKKKYNKVLKSRKKKYNKALNLVKRNKALKLSKKKYNKKGGFDNNARKKKIKECKIPKLLDKDNDKGKDTDKDKVVYSPTLLKSLQTLYNDIKCTTNYCNIESLQGKVADLLFTKLNNTLPNSWNQYMSDFYNHNSAQDNADICKYTLFRKALINYLIIIIIKYLFNNLDYNLNWFIGTDFQHIGYSNESKSINKNLIQIYVQDVGTQSPKSDYDLTIFSNPPHNNIPMINQYFNYGFQIATSRLSGTPMSSADIFDTNLYSHPVYWFFDKKQEAQTTTKYLIPLKELKDTYKYFFLPSDIDTYSNEKAFANVQCLPYFKNAGFKEKVGKEGDDFKFFNNPESNENNIQKDISIPAEKSKAEQLGKMGLSTSVAYFSGLCTSDGEAGELSDKTFMDSKCKIESTKQSQELNIILHTTRRRYESAAINFINKCMEDINNLDNKYNRTLYIGAMRASLYLADETYLTFSAYFHVIHCIQSVKTDESIYAINYLLQNKPDLFKQICKVSAIENFGFMFHYVTKPVEDFIKKTAKYLARISHALSLYKSIVNNNVVIDGNSPLENSTLGNHNYIIEKYKYSNAKAVSNDLDTSNTLYECYESEEGGTPLTPSKILTELYNKLTNETINSENIFGPLEIVIEPNE